MKKPTICRYCGGIIRLVPAADVYGSSTERLGMQNEYLYQCQNCNARVGCHKGTTRPLGDVANEILRLKPSKPIRCSTLTGRKCTSAGQKPISGWQEN